MYVAVPGGPFEEVAFSTPVGGVAKATSNFGIHLIQVLDARATPPVGNIENKHSTSVESTINRKLDVGKCS